MVGVDDPARAAAFWRGALGYGLRTDGFGGWATVLVPPPGINGNMIALQRSNTSPQRHPRWHLDLHVANASEQTTEVARLIELGATHVQWDGYPDDPDFVVLADTEGNLFCVVNTGHAPS